MRILAIDFGEKRLGIAMCDPLGITAQGLATYERKSFEQDCAYLSSLVKEYGVDTIVLGWPKNMDGTEGQLCKKVAEFALQMEERIPVRWDFYDERLTSAAAERTLINADVSRKKRKGVIDKMAATVILTDYLSSQAYIKRRNLPWKKDPSSN